MLALLWFDFSCRTTMVAILRKNTVEVSNVRRTYLNYSKLLTFIQIIATTVHELVLVNEELMTT